ncbi:MAG: GNAT family N-acetyltransferase [Steroidobacteraceae bacterium]
MAITYSLEPDLPAAEFRAILVASTLGERRPIDDLARLDRMLREADLIVTARDHKRLVGISRALTDFSYCCYLSDLAVDAAYQSRGIGRQLIAETHKSAGELTSLILLAAPKAESYYPHIGMKQRPSCWTLARTR